MNFPESLLYTDFLYHIFNSTTYFWRQLLSFVAFKKKYLQLTIRTEQSTTEFITNQLKYIQTTYIKSFFKTNVYSNINITT